MDYAQSETGLPAQYPVSQTETITKVQQDCYILGIDGYAAPTGVEFDPEEACDFEIGVDNPVLVDPPVYCTEEECPTEHESCTDYDAELVADFTWSGADLVASLDMYWLQDTLDDMINFYACDDSRLQLRDQLDSRVMHKSLTPALARGDVAYELGLRSGDEIISLCEPSVSLCHSLETVQDIADAYDSLSSYATSGGVLEIVFTRNTQTLVLELTIEDCPAVTGTPYGRCTASA